MQLSAEQREELAAEYELEPRRKDFEGRMRSAIAERFAIYDETVVRLRECVGASPDGLGIPKFIEESAMYGFDLSPSFEAGANGPESPVRDLMMQFAEDAAFARATVWRQRLTPDGMPRSIE